MEEEIKVSVITVVFNGQQTIRRTIESVLNQTYGNIEYIIIDGKSKDNTVMIAEEYRQKFKNRNIQYRIISEVDNGIYDAMNKGIRCSTGELIGIINSDDWYEKNTIEIIVNKYIDTQYDLVFGDIRMIKPNGDMFIKKAKQSKYITSRHWNHPTQFVHCRIYKNFMYSCNNMSDDMDFYFRVIKEKYHIEIISSTLANFMLGGVSSKISLKEIIPRIKRRYVVYRNNGFGRFYIIECIGFELIKFVAVRSMYV